MNGSMLAEFFQPEAIFFLILVAAFFLALHFFGGTWDSPKGLFFRILYLSLILLHGSLFSLVAWRFSPRVESTGVITNTDLNVSVYEPIRITLRSDGGIRVKLAMPSAAAHDLRTFERVTVTYTKWSARVVALRYAHDGVEIPMSAVPPDLKVLAEAYVAGAVILAAGLLCFAWIRRRNRPGPIVDLAQVGRG
jgi:hypothetical protein